MQVETEIKRWGNSLALRVSGIMAEVPGFSAGTRVSVEVTEEGLVVRPIREEVQETALPYAEKDLLSGLTPEGAHADEGFDLLPEELDDH
jgi:antitoxin MazE